MKRLNSVLGISVLGIVVGIASMSMAACGDDDDDVAGKGGAGGGKSGTGGSAGGGTAGGGTAGG